MFHSVSVLGFNISTPITIHQDSIRLERQIQFKVVVWLDWLRKKRSEPRRCWSCYISRLWNKKIISVPCARSIILEHERISFLLSVMLYGKSNFKILWTSLTLKIPLHFNYNFYKLEKLKLLTKTFKNSGKKTGTNVELFQFGTLQSSADLKCDNQVFVALWQLSEFPVPYLGLAGTEYSCLLLNLLQRNSQTHLTLAIIHPTVTPTFILDKIIST